MAKPLPQRKYRARPRVTLPGSSSSVSPAPASLPSPLSSSPARPPPSIREALYAAKVCLEEELVVIADLPPTNSFYVRVERISDVLDQVMDALGERSSSTNEPGWTASVARSRCARTSAGNTTSSSLRAMSVWPNVSLKSASCGLAGIESRGWARSVLEDKVSCIATIGRARESVGRRRARSRAARPHRRPLRVTLRVDACRRRDDRRAAVAVRRL